MSIDWPALEQAARLVGGTGPRIDGSSLLRMRSSLVDLVDEATAEVEAEAGMPASPKAELLVVDRHAWIGGNVHTLQKLFGEIDIKGAEAKLVAWEAGAFVGLLARAVLGQYDPYRDQLLVVYPNLGEMADVQGMRWLLFHEVTHVAQFRRAPWIADRILDVGKELLKMQQPGWGKEVIRQLPERLPDLIRWARDAYEGKASQSPLIELLPDEQREVVLRIHALVTLLEGHATHITELIARRVLPNHEEMNRRISQRRKRPPLMRVLEAIAGIDMKRQQYVIGKGFCEAVWAHGGAAALEPAWRGPEWVPTLAELKEPDRWIARAGGSGGSPPGERLQTPA